jgi:hypothetical protein
MSSAPKTPKTPPSTQVVEVDAIAKKQAELERRRKNSFYSSYRGSGASSTTLAVGDQTLG